jgi:hypothetical protein
VKKFGGKPERIGRETTLAADCNEEKCPAVDRLGRKELKTAAARGSIMRELVSQAPSTLLPNTVVD